MAFPPGEESGCFAVSEDELSGLMATPAAFRGWLHRRLLKRWIGVGYANHREMCPLAAWLHEVTQDYSIEIRKERLDWQCGELPLPSWMKGFVYLIDQTEGDWAVIQAGAALCSLSVAECLAGRMPESATPLPVREPVLAS